MTPDYQLPVGLTEFNEFAERIISKAGKFADQDSLTYALAMELIHSDPKTAFSDDYFVTRLRKVAANQVASQVINDIKAKQMAAMEAAKQAEATASTEDTSNGQDQKN